jgi:Zn-dependent protease with chaperone function
MSIWQLFFPLALSSVVVLLGLVLQARIGARPAAWMAAVGVVSIGTVGFLGTLLIAVQYWAHAPGMSRFVSWCAMLVGDHHSVSNTAGLGATALALYGIFRLTLFIRACSIAQRNHRNLRSLIDRSVVVEDTDAIFAYSVPGSTPLTVLSTGLLACLKADEYAIVLAHEEAHFAHRHDRFLLVGRSAAALFPPVQVFARALEYALERWADEHAASVIGDRKSVAKTVARTALLAHAPVPPGVLAFAPVSPFSTTQRVRSLLRPPQPIPAWAVLMCAFAVGGLLKQLHHLESIIQSLCGM